MSAVDSVNSSLYFSATALASKNVSQKEKDSKTQKSQKTKSFDTLFTEARQNVELDVSIPEIRGMTIEQAKEFLIDSVYSEGENLKQKPLEENIKRFRKAVTNFLKFVESQCYEIEDQVVSVSVKVGRVRVPKQKVYSLVKVVDEKLDNLAADILFNQKDQIAIAAKVNEISGLLVDILT